MQCGSSTWQWFLFAVYAGILAVFVGVVYLQTKPHGDAEHDSAALAIFLFHAQQLGLLLTTDGSFSRALASFIAFTAASSSTSLQTGFVLECFNSSFGLRERVLASLLPLVIVSCLLLLLVLAKVLRKTSSETHTRLVSLCVVFINILWLPAAQVSFSSLGCTDYRGTPAGASAYLNLFPWQQCDEHWKLQVMPTAVAGVVYCLFVLLVAAALAWLLYSSHANHNPNTSEPSWVQSVRPLITFFRPAYSWWFLVVLLRRLTLVLILAFLPYFSLYLPLALFAVIQASALLQQYVQPFARPMDNKAELASLYILQTNYLTSLLRSFSIDTDALAALDEWLIVLLAVNAAFGLVLSFIIILDVLPKISPVFAKITCCKRCQPNSKANADQLDEDSFPASPFSHSHYRLQLQ